MFKEIDLLLVVSDSIIEFCEELFNDIKIPVIQIINETIEYIHIAFSLIILPKKLSSKLNPSLILYPPKI